MKKTQLFYITWLAVSTAAPVFGQNLQVATAPQIPSASASGASFLSTVSGDGRFILFTSSARDLVPNDDLAGWMNIYRHDRATGESVLISLNAAAVGGGNRDSGMASPSTNGLVVFMSVASNLIVNDTNVSEDIFVRDVDAGSVRLVSIAVNGSVPANPPQSRNQPLSTNPLISQDGRYVAFESRAMDLVSTADTNGTYDVFVYDLQNSSTELVSIGINGTTANGISRLGAMTPDGRKIAFMSTATDLVSNAPTNGNEELYLRDLVSGETICLSAGLQVLSPQAPGPTSVYKCFYPALSADGASVIFKAAAPNVANASTVTYRSGVRTTITNNADLRSAPQISADSNWILYDAGGQIYRNSDLVTIGLTPSGENASIASAPTMSADASKIAFLVWSNNGPVQAYLRDMSGTSLELITATSAGMASSQNHALGGLIMDPNGTYVAFDSSDASLIQGDLNGANDVFLRGSADSHTILASHRVSSFVPGTSQGGNSRSKLALSGAGSTLLFASLDGDLMPGDANVRSDVFARDLTTGQLTSLSDSNGIFRADWGGIDPMISANGRYATFTRLGGSVGPGAGQPLALLRKDLQSGVSDLVTNLFTEAFSRRRAFNSPLSADGSLVVFLNNSQAWLKDVSAGTNRLIGGPFNSSVPVPTPLLSADETAILYWDSNSRVALHDLATGSNDVVAAAAEYAFSANSRYVLTWSPSSVSRYDRMTTANVVVCTSCSNPSISSDGRLVVYESGPLTSRSIELRDMEANTTALISQNAHGVNGNGRSTSPVISGDGAFVVFVSRASDLAPGDINGTADIFVRDLRLNKTVRIIGELPDGTMGAGPASTPVLAADGRTLAFQSFSARMVANDFDQNGDIFVLRLEGGDIDNDALPDDWEVAYFGNLDQTASGDFDHDGHTNAQEYTADTDPTNQNSVLRVLTLLSSTTGQTQLFWSAIPGKTYRVEFKASLVDSQWTPFPDLVTASGTTASATDPNSGFTGTRFYRVVTVD
jgi:Tol biopolymer transport system component